MKTVFKSLIVTLGIIIYGCDFSGAFSKCEDSIHYPYWKDWQDGSLISILNDSLAILSTSRKQIGCVDDFFFGKIEEEKDNHPGLFLVNYRTKQKPLLGDTLNYGLHVVGDYFRNFSVLVFNSNHEKFGFWTVGKESMGLKRFQSDSISNIYFNYHNVYNAKPWLNRNILLKTDGGYELSILNPGDGPTSTTGRIDTFAFSGKYEWLAECADMSYINNKLVCIRENTEGNYIELVANDVVADTSSLYYYSKAANLYGNYVMDGGGRIHKIDTLTFKFDRDFKLWYRSGKFYNDIEKPDEAVFYSGEDLTGRK